MPLAIRILFRVFRRLREDPPALPVPLAFSSCRIHRNRKKKDGLRYKLLVSLPHGYDDAAMARKRYPVIVALDAEPYLFPLLTIVARTNHFFARSYYFPDVIVVGIVADLESESRFHCGPGGRLNVPLCWKEQRPTRARDYLPTRAESPWGGPGAASLLEVSGHAEEFCDYLVDEVLPFIDAKYRTRGAAARALVGKSFGGCGVAAAMLHERAAKAFSEHVMGSPSIAWDDNAWFRLEAAAREKAMRAPDAATVGSPPYGAGVYCCLGAEKDVDPELIYRMKQILDGRRGAGTSGVGGHKGGGVEVVVLEGETHGSVSYPFVHHAMEWLRPRWAVFDAIEGDNKAQALLDAHAA